MRELSAAFLCFAARRCLHPPLRQREPALLLGAVMLAMLLLPLQRSVAVDAQPPEGGSLPPPRHHFVRVGDPGNPSPPDGGCGRVDYEFALSVLETTNGEYAGFLNAVARSGDPFQLYSPLMATHFWGGIIRSEVHGGYAYAAKPGYARLPMTFVAWTDAVRFANWLHYGRPDKGVSELGTTEGTAQRGAYDTSASMDAITRRNPGARFFLPTCDEWVKAGFYVAASRLYLQFSGSDIAPAAGGRSDAARAANYYSGRWAEPYPHLARVGKYAAHASPYGTLDQGGNVMEWAEDMWGGGRLALGGSLFMGVDALHREYRDLEQPLIKLSSFGMRIAATPEASDDLASPAVPEVEDSSVVRVQDTVGVADEVATPQTEDIQWMSVDRPGNVFDLRTGYGCVPYAYEIARFEITNAQYAEFLNAVAAHSDPHALFSPDMESGVVGGIRRIDRNGATRYEPWPHHERKPATYISWTALARFANWLHYGRPATGRSELGTTEGDATRGAYDTQAFEKLRSRATRWTFQDLRRNPQAGYFIPSNDEWYKAAYYDPQRSGVYKYWRFPTRTAVAPANDSESRPSANYQRGNELGAGPPYYLGAAGEFHSDSYFGVEDLGGSVWEWLEDWRGLGGESCWRCDRATKGLRGGSFNYIETGLRSSNIDPGLPTDAYFTYGGRLARAAPTAARASCLLASRPGARKSIAAVVNLAERKKMPLLAGFVILSIASAWFIRFRARKNVRRGADRR